MKDIANFIIESLRINKDMKFKRYDVLKIVLDVINPKSDKVKDYLEEWIKDEGIEEIEIWVQNYDYRKILNRNKNIKDIIKSYIDTTSPTHKVINRELYDNIKRNWHFIDQHEGIGRYKNYFAYAPPVKRYFSGLVYIVGI